jgi:hypothetical protein
MRTLRPVTILKAAAERAARSATLLKALLGVSALLLALAPPMARAGEAGSGHNFQFCNGYYAICAASTCSPTGKMIKVNVAGGGTAMFPQVDCKCPIFHGRAIADVTGGNMQGSCDPPEPGTGQIWSLFSHEEDIPQELNGWAQTPESAEEAPPQICPAALNLGKESVNCFSFACDTETYINNVPIVTCHCPKGESFAGTPVDKHTAFAIQAGQRNKAFCAKLPISLPFTLE